MMKYKGYLAKVEFDDEAMLLHGEVVGTRDVITFQGRSATEIEAEFHRSVDTYLAQCARRKVAPEKPFSGQVLVRMPPDLHRDVSGIARDAGLSVNSWVVQTLAHALAPTPELSQPRDRDTRAASPGTKSGPQAVLAGRPVRSRKRT